MKTQLLFILLFLPSFALGSTDTPPTLRISGTVADSVYNGRVVKLEAPGGSAIEPNWIDSAKIIDGKYEFVLQRDSLTEGYYHLSLLDIGPPLDPAHPWPHYQTLTFFVDDYDMVVDFQAFDSVNPIFNPILRSPQCGMNYDFLQLNNQIEAVSAQLSQLYSKHRREDSFIEMNDPEVFEAEYIKLISRLRYLNDSVASENVDNGLGLYLQIKRLLSYKTLAQLDSIENIYTLARNNIHFKQRRIEIIQSNNTTLGAPFVDFELTDVDGNPCSLSDFLGKGNYVIVFFWNLDLGLRIEYLLKTYERYKDQGLRVIAVNSKGEREEFVRLINHHKMPWESFIASAQVQQQIDKTYDIILNTMLIFAPDGSFVTRASDPSVEYKVDEIYSQ